MSDLSLRKGDIFANRYRIEDIIGVGGYAHVYLATQLDLERPVALKILTPVGKSTVAPPPETLERFFKRFEREAKIVSKLQAPETVEVYEFGRTDDGFAFMALEYIEGKNLLKLMNDEAPLEPSRVEKIVTGILRSLREAHDLGVHHRDVKPANIMVFTRFGEADRVKVLDFGVVKITRDIGVSHSSLTSEGNVVGTPRYMAPEYIRDNIVTPRTDLYGVGLVAWEMLVGEPAVKGDTAMEVMTAQVAPEPLKLPHSIDVSPRLRTVVDGLLEKEPRRRFASADDVLELIETGTLAGVTQDGLSLAATIESHEIRDVADQFEPPENFDELHRLAASTAPKPNSRRDPRRSVASLDDGPLELDLPAENPSATDDPTRQSPLMVLAIIAAVAFGAVVGIAVWWLLRG